jgi:deoxyribonuclease-4
MTAMLPDGRRLGAHLPLGGGMVKAVERAHVIGAQALQIFTDNPTAWRRRAAPPPELGAFVSQCIDYDLRPTAIHGSYLINLAGPDPLSHERSMSILVDELRVAPAFGARFVNIHIGSHRGTGLEAGIVRLADGVAQVLSRVQADPGFDGSAPGAVLVLENSAGSGGGIGTTVDELTSIADALAARGIDRQQVGYCLDTAHAWGAGIDMGEPDAIDTTLADFDARIGLDRLVMVHLNDSRSELGSRLDRHEHLGAGRIGRAGLERVLRHPGLAHATYYLETPGMDRGYDAINLARAQALAAGLPLEPLPEGAFDLPGSAATRTGPR